MPYRVTDIAYYGTDCRRIYMEKTAGPAKHYWAHNERFMIEVFPFDNEAEAQAFCAERKRKFAEAAA